MFLLRTKYFLKLASLSVVALMLHAAALPRKSPALTITQPSGDETQLSSFGGKVVVIEFFFVRSPHCLRLVEMLNKLNREFGPQGFHAIGVAFGPGASPAVLSHLVEHFKLTYPVGYATAEKVDAYLGREGKETLKIPQMVIIDRNGAIRAASGNHGNAALENEAPLRSLIQILLHEKRSSLENRGGGVRGESASNPGTPPVETVEDRQPAPNFTLRDTRGDAVRLADYRGKVVLLDFWATWCIPCKAEIPWFNEFGKEYQERGFAVLGVALDGSGRNAVMQYAARQKIGYRILLGDELTARQYGGVHALPETLLIDRDGRIAARHVGITSKTGYEREIGELLGVKVEPHSSHGVPGP
jgi:peroxiredoxin